MMKYIFRFTPKFTAREEIILRDYLALERSKLANERTLLSYIRTSLYLALGGIAFLQLENFGNINWIGYIALALSITFLVTGIIRYHRFKRRLWTFYNNMKK
ncbi:hypothetical protein C900_04213 [Fulvivirga imtechensis AK7]|uniref:DUF202 domain-containing protein n=1 Tax=Fulvivirga imtechensis AK7 TaxID=1237149 RepID=L8JWE9_9BACT|nr:DUF202 domain-containing protein [Fulvivirga imtechensis]ELR73361.1 hypothetical protein C900_04213 [Fulvivirga imtechensis AK7]